MTKDQLRSSLLFAIDMEVNYELKQLLCDNKQVRSDAGRFGFTEEFVNAPAGLFVMCLNAIEARYGVAAARQVWDMADSRDRHPDDA